MLIKSLAPWFAMLCLAVANGALREAVLIPAWGKSAGLVMSGVLLSLLIALVSLVFVRFQKYLRPSQGLTIGAFWLFLTLAFEFSFGRLVQHKPWVELMEAYTFKDGNIWPVVLLVMLAAPFLSAFLQSRSPHAKRGA